eukprot:TRINITY_DN66440_c10_g1_i1.p2 TRINITY_DN66440_c10_g1~~TRINITY_DN66440_c10_g1_i1.p2  ORF type:complete len:136 (-),score=56.36 TRINITY_DN66440_c10_g1_i1:160-567(-)
MSNEGYGAIERTAEDDSAGEWKMELFGMFDIKEQGDFILCFKGICCAPCVGACTINTFEDRGQLVPLVLYCCCWPCFGTIKRGQIREAHGIPGSPVEDFLWSCCCGCCARVQEHIEVGDGQGGPPLPENQVMRLP